MKYKAKANIIALGLHVRRDEVITEEQYKKVPEELPSVFTNSGVTIIQVSLFVFS